MLKANFDETKTLFKQKLVLTKIEKVGKRLVKDKIAKNLTAINENSDITSKVYENLQPICFIINLYCLFGIS